MRIDNLRRAAGKRRVPENVTMLKAEAPSNSTRTEANGEFKLGYVPALDGLRAV